MDDKRLSPEEITAFLPRSGVYSPSFIESYMTCPFRWFIERGLRLTDKTKQIGPREVGIIVHNVLHEVMLAAQSDPEGRISQCNLTSMTDLALLLYDREVETYINEKRVGSPLTHEERSYLDAKKRDLSRFLAAQAQFNRDFKPTYLEYEISGMYAGRKFKGYIDRVDTCNNAAVIIDYKYGSKDCVSYSNDKNGILKVQAAIYAQLIRREYNLTPVGCLYVCTSKFKVGGAIDGDWFGFDEKNRVYIDGLNCTKLAVMQDDQRRVVTEELGAASFIEYLDLVEKRVEQAINRLESGVLEKCANEKGSTCPLAGICLCEEGSYGF